MALPKDYRTQHCSLARSLEIIGERWTLLIVRDAFFGVRRFGDFAAHLTIPRAVLTERLKALVEEGVFSGTSGRHGHSEYVLTEKGLALWPVVRALLAWGDQYHSPGGPRRVFHHDADGGAVDAGGSCAVCGEDVPVGDLVVAPGPGAPVGPAADLVTDALAGPHHLLEPIRTYATSTPLDVVPAVEV